MLFRSDGGDLRIDTGVTREEEVGSGEVELWRKREREDAQTSVDLALSSDELADGPVARAVDIRVPHRQPRHGDVFLEKVKL